MRSFEEKRALESRNRLLAAASSLGREVIWWCGVECTEVAVSNLQVWRWELC